MLRLEGQYELERHSPDHGCGPSPAHEWPAEATWHHGAVPAFSSKALPLIPLWPPMRFLTLSDDVEHLFMWVIVYL